MKDHTYDDDELDAILNAALAGMLEKITAAFDPAAGLADIQRRRGTLRPSEEPQPSENWRCRHCDVWNSSGDTACQGCDTGRREAPTPSQGRPEGGDQR